MDPRTRTGWSLVELTVALALMAILCGIAAPPLRRALVIARVRAARDVVAAELARARALAVARGGAELRLERRTGTVRVHAADTALEPVPVAVAGGVELEVDGVAGDTVCIGFDAMGIGRMASRTIRVRAAGVEAGVTISSYGRVRSW
jgi:type II secretory pathway pseudopilin PulG